MMEANNMAAMRQALECLLKERDILSVPPRNCDIGTAEEQRRRYDEWRNHDELRAAFGKDEFEWAQMPYEEGGNDGSK